MKKFIYVLLPLQVLILFFSPRFGWKIHNPESIVLSYKDIAYIDGKIHTLYENENHQIDIVYENIFSKQFLVIVDGKETYKMEVGIDGVTHTNENILHFTSGDIIWNDSCGIFWWRYILTIGLTVSSITLIQRISRINVYSCILYTISILISLRIIF